MNMIKTRITELLKIRYPILQGGMQGLSRAELGQPSQRPVDSALSPPALSLPQRSYAKRSARCGN